MEMLDPRDFAATAARAIAACAGADPAAVLAEAGLLGVIAPEAVGGLGLPLRFAVPLLEAAGGGELSFPLIETLLLARHLPADVAEALVAGAARGSIAWAGSLERGVVARAPLGAEADWLLVRHGDGAALLPRAACTPREAVGLDETTPEHAFAVAGPPHAALGADAWAALQEEALLLSRRGGNSASRWWSSRPCATCWRARRCCWKACAAPSPAR